MTTSQRSKHIDQTFLLGNLKQPTLLVQSYQRKRPPSFVTPLSANYFPEHMTTSIKGMRTNFFFQNKKREVLFWEYINEALLLG